jgi:serine/threonine protein phosphatase PrpC
MDKQTNSHPAVIYSHTQVGGGIGRLNQDQVFVFTSRSKYITIGGVFDGHSDLGGMTSMVARQYCEDYFATMRSACDSWTQQQFSENIIQLFADMHGAIRRKMLACDTTTRVDPLDIHGVPRHKSGSVVRGGTTATLVVRKKYSDGSGYVISANAGDSSAFKFIISPNGLNKSVKYVQLSDDHDPMSRSEFMRVKGLSTRLYPDKMKFVYDVPYIYPEIFEPSGQIIGRYLVDPWKQRIRTINARNDVSAYCMVPHSVDAKRTCFAMTRSLGDFYGHQCGLIFQPSIKIQEFNATEDHIICVASDGLWDCWKYDDLADAIRRILSDPLCYKIDINHIASTIFDQTIKRGIQMFGEKDFDDTSIVMW